MGTKYVFASAVAEIVLVCRLANHMLLYAMGMLNQTQCEPTLVCMKWQCL